MGKKVSHSSIHKNKRNYDHVDQTRKKKLIEEVTSKKRKVKDVAREMKINYSNAKHIVSFYLRTGKLRN
jgi:hypothetical protein